MSYYGLEEYFIGLKLTHNKPIQTLPILKILMLSSFNYHNLTILEEMTCHRKLQSSLSRLYASVSFSSYLLKSLKGRYI